VSFPFTTQGLGAGVFSDEKDCLMSMPSKDKRRRKRRLFRTDGPCCQICGECFAFHVLTLDHIIPRSQGGPHALWNLRLACYDCNYGRHH
jgi:5-methylcytosine-specific restriction endonuclease McrA